MADAPVAPNPNAIVNPNALPQSAPPSAPVAPAAASSPAATPSPPAQTGDREFPIDQIFEWTDPKTSQPRSGSFRQMTEALDRVSALPADVDVNYLLDLDKALKNDSAASARILERQLGELKKSQPPAAPPNPEIAQLQAQLDEMKQAYARVMPIVQTTEDAQIDTYVGNLLRGADVQKEAPFLAAKPEIGVPIVRNIIKDLKRQYGNQQVPGQVFAQRVMEADINLGRVAKAYGGSLPANGNNGQSPVVAFNEQKQAPYTAETILQERYGIKQGQPASVGVVPSHVPPAGGQIGSPAGGVAPQQNRQYTSDQLREQMRVRRESALNQGQR